MDEVYVRVSPGIPTSADAVAIGLQIVPVVFRGTHTEMTRSLGHRNTGLKVPGQGSGKDVLLSHTIEEFNRRACSRKLPVVVPLRILETNDSEGLEGSDFASMGSKIHERVWRAGSGLFESIDSIQSVGGMSFSETIMISRCVTESALLHTAVEEK